MPADISSTGSSAYQNIESDILQFAKTQEQAILKARMLLAAGQDVAFIAHATGLSMETVMRLQREANV